MTKDVREKLEYFITFPIYIAFAVAFAGLLSRTVLSGINMGYFLCYFVINLMIIALLKALGYEKWDIVIEAAFTGLLILIFRDKILMLNQLAALGAAGILFVLRKEKIERYAWPFVTVVLTALWLICCTDMPRYTAICLVALLFYSITFIFKKDLRYVLAIPVIIAVVTFFTPVNEEPCQWTVIKKAIASTGEFFADLADNTVYFFESFGFSGGAYSGYSSDGKLTGSVSDYHRTELEFVNRTNNRRTVLYLKGRSYLDIDREGFSGLDEVENESAWFALYMNALYHADIDKKEAGFMSQIVNSDIVYRYLRTGDVIRPMTTLAIYEEGQPAKVKKKGYTYWLRYLLVDYGSPYFKEVADIDEQLPPEDYDTIVKYTKEVYNIDFNNILTEEEYIAAVSEKDMSEYLKSDFATDRVKDLAEDITKDCSNDYEKAVMIERYLCQYEYSKDVDLTKSDNYVDEFLFETQKGYCVHFASSMVMMLRSVGIPARYTVGYRHDEHLSFKEVMSNEAHAWPEAYIEGFGWMPFEPTGCMKTPDEYTWGLGKGYNPDAEVEFASVGDAGKPGFDFADKDKVPYDIPKVDEQSIKDKKAEQDARRREVLVRVGIYTALLILAAILLIVVVLVIKKIRYSLMTPEEKLRHNVIHMLKVLDESERKKAGKGAALKDRKMSEYPELIEDESVRDTFSKILDDYSRVRFRGDAATEEEVKVSEELRRKGDRGRFSVS